MNLPLSHRDRLDEVRADFLAELDDNDQIDLSEFELKFLESNLDRDEFSPRQRIVIDSMRKKYERFL